MARADSNDAVPSSGTWSNDAASAIAAHRSAAAVCPVNVRHPACQHDERWIRLDGSVAQCSEPSLDSRDLARAVGRQRQLRDEPDASVSLGGVQQVLDGQGRRPVGFVPVGGAQVQLGGDVGLDASQLPEQELPVQGVVAEPLPVTIERDQERVRGLQGAQPRLTSGFAEDGIAQRGTQLVEHCRTPQETLGLARQQRQGLAVQVVGHEAVVSGDRQPLLARWLAITAARCRPTGQPSVRSVASAATS